MNIGSLSQTPLLRSHWPERCTQDAGLERKIDTSFRMEINSKAMITVHGIFTKVDEYRNTERRRSGPITIIYHNLTGEFGFLISSTLEFVDLEVLISRGGVLPPGDTVKIPLNLKLQPSPGYFSFLMPRGQQARS